MTAVLTRPPLPARTGSAGGRGRALLAAVLAAGAAAGTGLVAVALLVLLVWATGGRTDASGVDALRAAAQLWLVGQGAPLSVGEARLGVAPLGLVLLNGLLLMRAGGSVVSMTGSADLPAAGRAAALLVTAYALIALLVAGVSASPSVRPPPIAAALAAALLAAVAGGLGVLRAAGLFGAAAALFPARTRALGRATAGAVAVLLGVGAALAGASLAVHLVSAGRLAEAVDAGIVGAIIMLVLGLALVPNAVVWGSAYALGPGFAVGVGTSVAPSGVALSALPALPLLAALPASGPAPMMAAPALLAPLVAGVVAGLLVVRTAPTRTPQAGVLLGLACGPCSGAAIAMLAWLSGGPLGPGRLAAVGPSPWRVGLAAAVEVGLVAAVTAGWMTGSRRAR